MKKWHKRIIILASIIILNIIVIGFIGLPKNIFMQLDIELAANNASTYKILYSKDDTFGEEYSEEDKYDGAGSSQKLKFEIPMEYNQLRLELGEHIDTIRIDSAKLSCMGQEIDLIPEIMQEDNLKNDIGDLEGIENGMQIQLTGEHPYIILSIANERFEEIFMKKNFTFKLMLCVLISLITVIVFKMYKTIKGLVSELDNNRRLIWNLSKNDFKTKYAGSYLGITWAFVQPIITVLVYWFVFQVGFKSIPVEGFPYVLWLIAGIVPWFFFNDAILNAMNSLMEYSYLVKKVVFKISILPIVKIISALFVHLFFVGFMLVLFMLYGYMPNVYTLQIIYYSMCLFVLVLGISYITSSIIVFFRDLGQIVSIFLQVGMWMTPILWDVNILSDKYQTILKLNPVYYIVSGYRDSLINKVWFWERYNQTIYFWSVAIVVFVIGTVIYKRLKPHFADVL